MNDPLLSLMAAINKMGNDALDRAEANIKKSQSILNDIGGAKNVGKKKGSARRAKKNNRQAAQIA